MKRPPDPYRWLFPIGMLFGIVGTGLWVLHWGRFIRAYPGIPHAEIMMGGFLLTMAVGFLMTAIPKFTGTASAMAWEQRLAGIAAAGLLATALLPDRLGFHIGLLITGILLIRFAAVRFLRAHFQPPPSFLFVGFGCGATLFSAVILIGHDAQWALHPTLVLFARQLLVYGVWLFFVLGIGTQLIPALLGTRPAQRATLGASPLMIAPRPHRWRFPCYALGLLISFIAEVWWQPQIGTTLRAGIVTIVLLKEWHLLRRRENRGVHSWGLWCSAWCLLIGSWAVALFPAYAIHAAHILFIGTVSLMIFMIATRVTLAHGGHDLREEHRSRWLMGVIGFLLLAALTRLLAPVFPAHYLAHLAYAAICWIAAAVVWGIRFVPRMMFTNLSAQTPAGPAMSGPASR